MNRPFPQAIPTLLAAAGLIFVGCRTAGHVVKGATTVAVTSVKIATGTAETAVRAAVTIVKDFDYYAKKAHILRGYHESKPLHSADVLVVLAHRRKTEAERKLPPLPKYGGPYRWPLDAGIVSSEFGRRWGRMHEGIDIAADPGEPVRASANGRVIYAGDGLRGYGNVVILRHDSRTTTLYAHNSALEVRVGEMVRTGQTIALLGSTGHSTGPHVHFEIRAGNLAFNPRRRLPQTRF